MRAVEIDPYFIEMSFSKNLFIIVRNVFVSARFWWKPVTYLRDVLKCCIDAKEEHILNIIINKCNV